jgi:hypothetical protein
MDLITGLPRTPQGHNAILVICDKLSKMVHYIATTKKATARQVAELLIDNVVRLHGVPRQVITDGDPRFIAEFYHTFTNALGIACGFSTSHHPQTDGQTERVNQVLEDYLRHYVKPLQTDWDKHLSMAEFAFNNSFHESTQNTPFRVVYGVDPLTPVSLLTPQEALTQENLRPHCPGALASTQQMQQNLQQARRCLEAANQRMKATTDKRRKPMELQVGDEVLLRTRHLRVKGKIARKLFPRFIGPFTITKKINPVAYRLHLPHTLSIHPVFHVSELKPYIKGSKDRPPPIPTGIQGDYEWEVESIKGHEVRGRGTNSENRYLVHWKGYPDEFDTWEPEPNLLRCRELVRDYQKGVATPTHSTLG